MSSEHETQTAPDMPAQAPPQDVMGFLTGINATLDDLTRYAAGYNTLTRVYATVTDQLQPGQRPKGLLLNFKGSVDDIHAVDVTIDVQKHVRPEYFSHVLGPLANGQAMGMLATVERLVAEVTALHEHVESLLGLQQQTPDRQPAAPAA